MKESTNRREFIRTAGLATIGAIALSKTSNVFGAPLFSDATGFTLPALPYAFGALEPHIDALTMEIHHDRHHKTYVDNLNKAVTENKITETSLEVLFSKVSTLPTAIRNSGGGHYNHSMFWEMMKPNGGGVPTGAIADAINTSFTNFETFKTKFSDASKARFGSGWTWLVAKGGKLEIGSTPNQDNPLMDLSELKGTPVLCLDVWEHAYYLHYQNKRADYITAWFNVVNWDAVNKRLAMAK
jgi:Fe-Mn family superoxide dismutase